MKAFLSVGVLGLRVCSTSVCSNLSIEVVSKSLVWFKGQSTGNHGFLPLKYGGFPLNVGLSMVFTIKRELLPLYIYIIYIYIYLSKCSRFSNPMTKVSSSMLGLWGVPPLPKDSWHGGRKGLCGGLHAA